MNIEVVGGGQVIGGRSSTVHEINAGDTSVGASFLNINSPASNSDMDYDAVNNRILISVFGGHRVDIYDRPTGMFLGSPLSSPQILVCDCVDYDETTDTVYALSRISSVIGGMPQFGDQGTFDNVVLGGSSMGPSSAATAFTPASGSGNVGVNSQFEVVKASAAVVSGLRFDPTGATANFNVGAGTFTMTATVNTIVRISDDYRPDDRQPDRRDGRGLRLLHRDRSHRTDGRRRFERKHRNIRVDITPRNT